MKMILNIMENQLMSCYPSVKDKKWTRNDISEETKKALLAIIDEFLLETSFNASEITLDSMMNEEKSTNRVLFSQNIEEYLNLMVPQHIKTFFSTRLDRSIEYFCKALVKSQNNLILNSLEPFDLKFKLKDGKGYYCTNNKSVNDQTQSCDEYILNGNDFWTFLTDPDYARFEITRLINGSANNYSVSSIINETKTRLLKEWEIQGKQE